MSERANYAGEAFPRIGDAITSYLTRVSSKRPVLPLEMFSESEFMSSPEFHKLHPFVHQEHLGFVLEQLIQTKQIYNDPSRGLILTYKNN